MNEIQATIDNETILLLVAKAAPECLLDLHCAGVISKEGSELFDSVLAVDASPKEKYEIILNALRNTDASN